MQEEIENRAVNLAITTTRLSWQVIQAAYRQYKILEEQDRQREAAWKEQHDTPTGRMTVKQLVGKDRGVSSLDISNTSLRDFGRIAGKYGIDYAIVKDRNTVPPRYTVFFKAKEADAMTAAFSEYTAQMMNVDKRPSIRKALQHFAAVVASIPDKTRNRHQEQTR